METSIWSPGGTTVTPRLISRAHLSIIMYLAISGSAYSYIMLVAYIHKSEQCCVEVEGLLLYDDPNSISKGQLLTSGARPVVGRLGPRGSLSPLIYIFL
jgi:hypothetical protein